MTKITIFISFTLWHRSMSPVICEVTIGCQNSSQIYTLKRMKDSVWPLALRLAATDIQLACGYMMLLTRFKKMMYVVTPAWQHLFNTSVMLKMLSSQAALQELRQSLSCTMLDYYVLFTITHMYHGTNNSSLAFLFLHMYFANPIVFLLCCTM